MIKGRITLLICAALFPLFAACTGAKRQELPAASLVVINGTVIDGTGTEPIPNGLVAIDGNRIVAVGQSTDFKIPQDVAILDATGGTILPGVFNSHAHGVAGVGTRRVSFLLNGVTSVCDLGVQLQRMRAFEEEQIGSGPAARGFKAGPIVTVPGGYPDPPFSGLSYAIRGENEADIAVRDLHSRGADYIKVALEPGIFGDPWPVLNLQELRAIVATAHSLDLLVRAHVNNAKLDVALDGGVDVIEHVPMPSFSYEDLEFMFDEAGDFHIPSELGAQMLRMIDQGIVLVPTLDVLIEDTYLEGDIEHGKEAVAHAILDVVRFFHDSGGNIALGNDYSNAGVESGMPLDEMAFLQAAGLSPMEVIEAATKYAAFVCGQSDELGTLERGKLADLLIVDGNPLEDLNVLESVLYVVKDGEVVVSPEQVTK